MVNRIPAAAGVGLRFPHHGVALRPTPGVNWLEVHPENYLLDPGALVHLRRAREHLPLSLHAVGWSLGSVDGVSRHSLQRLRTLIDELAPGLVSDHLSFSIANGHYLPDLLPLPYTEEALEVVVKNVDAAQDALGRQLLVENPSVYLSPAAQDFDEPDFMAALVKRTGCGVLLDVNNVFVTATNTGQDPNVLLQGFLAKLPREAIGEIHLAGHTTRHLDSGQRLLLDDHGSKVGDAVWALYRAAIEVLGRVPTLVEWDNHLPEWQVLAAEALQTDAVLDALHGPMLAGLPLAFDGTVPG